ncbi:MAG: alpha-xenorhabdolysin family binary toxin subunit A [Marinifilaceae bacterium]|jgi:hypothetical protein
MEEMIVTKNEVAAVQPSEAALTNVQLLAGKHPEGERGAGIITEGDIANIKRYVGFATSLPTKLSEIETVLGYKKLNVAGLEPSDFQPLFQETNAHGKRWYSLESDLRKQAVELEVSADEIQTTGEAILDLVSEMPPVERARKVLGDISDEKLESMGEDQIENEYGDLKKDTFSSNDKVVAQSIGEVLQTMREDIKGYALSTTELRDRITAYNIDINNLHGSFLAKNKIMNSTTFDEKLNEVVKEVKQLEKKYKDACADYDRNVKKCFSGAPGGLIGMGISSSIFGPKATAAKKRRDSLKKDLDKKREERAALQSSAKAVNKLVSFSEGISPIFKDALKALNDLETIWQSFAAYIESSHKAFMGIDNGLKLVLFQVKFKKVIKPWESVRGLAAEVTSAMNNALDKVEEVKA